MDKLLYQWLQAEYSLTEPTEITCPECEDCHLTRDILDDVFRCDSCESYFTSADAAAE
jgi:uncharacterized protein (DUF983 family)